MAGQGVHEPAGNKFLRQTESIIICQWNAFIASLDLFIMISWCLIWAFSFCYSSSAKTDRRRGSSESDLRFADRRDFISRHKRVFVHCQSILVEPRTPLTLQLHRYPDSWSSTYSLARRSAVCVKANAEQMEKHSSGLFVYPPPPMLVFEAAVWAYVSIISRFWCESAKNRLISR